MSAGSEGEPIAGKWRMKMLSIMLSGILAMSCVPAFALAGEADEAPAGAEATFVEAAEPSSKAAKMSETTTDVAAEKVETAESSVQASVVDAVSSETVVIAEEEATDAEGEEISVSAETGAASEESDKIRAASSSEPGALGSYTVNDHTYAGTYDDPVRILVGQTVALPVYSNANDWSLSWAVGAEYESRADGVEKVYGSGLTLHGKSVSSAPVRVFCHSWMGGTTEALYVQVVATEAELDPNPVVEEKACQVSFDWGRAGVLPNVTPALPVLAGQEVKQGEEIVLPSEVIKGQVFLSEYETNKGFKMTFQGWSTDYVTPLDFVVAEGESMTLHAVWTPESVDLTQPGARGPYVVNGVSYAGTADDPIVITEGETISVTGAFGEAGSGWGDNWYVNGSAAYGSDESCVGKNYGANKTVRLIGKKVCGAIPVQHTYDPTLIASQKQEENFYVKVVPNSEEPVNPIDPVDPIEPVDPVDPADPIDPVDPVNPADPMQPDEPSDQPSEPVQPSQSDQPGNGSSNAGSAMAGGSSAGASTQVTVRPAAVNVAAAATAAEIDAATQTAAPSEAEADATNEVAAEASEASPETVIADEENPLAEGSNEAIQQNMGLTAGIVTAIIAAIAGWWLLIAKRRKKDEESA